MKKTVRKVTGSILLVVLLASLYGGTIQATQSQLDEVQDNIEKLEEKKEEAKRQADSLSDSADSLQGDLKKFNDSLANVTAELNETEEKLRSTRAELKKTKKALKAAKVKEQEQYEAMKKRIQFMYEMDTGSMMEMLMESDSIAEFLNRSEYIVSIHEYDRNMLTAYRETKEEIRANKELLAAKETELTALQEAETAKRQELTALISDTSQQLASAKEQIAAAKANAEEYEAELARQRAYEEELEAKKAAEDAARQDEIKDQEEELEKEPSGPINADTSDTELLAAIIYCEAGSESYEGKLAVGSVVINRMRSSYFPNTLAGVIYQKGQFSPVASGRLATALAEGANSECIKAAKEVLGGRITLNCLYFRRNNGTINGIVIGNHVFY